MVGAEPPPSRNREAYQSLSDTDYDSSPRPCERTLCVVLQSESEVLVVPRLEGPAALPPICVANVERAVRSVQTRAGLQLLVDTVALSCPPCPPVRPACGCFAQGTGAAARRRQGLAATRSEEARRRSDPAAPWMQALTRRPQRMARPAWGLWEERDAPFTLTHSWRHLLYSLLLPQRKEEHHGPLLEVREHRTGDGQQFLERNAARTQGQPQR